ncbi:MAG: lipocalin family protein [Acidobacteriota bacterium]
MALGTSPETPVRTVPSVDLERYLGRWHEAARLPNRFQKDCASDVTADYSRRDDGRIRVVNRCRRADASTIEAEGVARVVDEKTNAKLKVRFAPSWLSVFPFVWGDYWIIALADDYSYAVVGAPNRDYLWFLSRTASMPDAAWEAAERAAKENGFDVARMIRTKSSPHP